VWFAISKCRVAVSAQVARHRLDTSGAVLAVFIDAYNKFGEAKMKCGVKRNLAKNSRELPFFGGGVILI